MSLYFYVLLELRGEYGCVYLIFYITECQLSRCIFFGMFEI